MSLGKRLRETREARGLTQRALADLVGVRIATISELERGTRKGMHTTLAKKLARVLGVSVDHLIGTWEPDEETQPAAVALVGT